MIFFEIVGNITLPLIALIALGYTAVRRLSLDVDSLGRLLVYAVLPCALLHFITSAELPLADVTFSALFTVVQFIVIMAIGWVVAPWIGIEDHYRPIFAAAVAFPNSGNYGIPLAELAFGSDWVLHQSVITSIHLVLIVLVVSLMVTPAYRSGGLSLRMIYASPLVPAVVAGLLIKAANVELPVAVARPLEIIGGAFTPLALMTLGGQLATTRWLSNLKPALWITGFSLLLVPALTFAALNLAGAGNGITAFLTVGACTPVGILLVILVAEHKPLSALVSAAVLISTFLSPLVVTAALILLSPA